MPADLFRVLVLLSRLSGEITRETFEVLVLAPERQSQVIVRRAEFLVHLAVEFGADFGWDLGRAHSIYAMVSLCTPTAQTASARFSHCICCLAFKARLYGSRYRPRP